MDVSCLSDVLGLAVFVENKNVTDRFNATNVSQELEATSVSITKKNTTQFEISFKSGE